MAFACNEQPATPSSSRQADAAERQTGKRGVGRVDVAPILGTWRFDRNPATEAELRKSYAKESASGFESALEKVNAEMAERRVTISDGTILTHVGERLVAKQAYTVKERTGDRLRLVVTGPQKQELTIRIVDEQRLALKMAADRGMHEVLLVRDKSP